MFCCKLDSSTIWPESVPWKASQKVSLTSANSCGVGSVSNPTPKVAVTWLTVSSPCGVAVQLKPFVTPVHDPVRTCPLPHATFSHAWQVPGVPPARYSLVGAVNRRHVSAAVAVCWAGASPDAFLCAAPAGDGVARPASAWVAAHAVLADFAING